MLPDYEYWRKPRLLGSIVFHEKSKYWMPILATAFIYWIFPFFLAIYNKTLVSRKLGELLIDNSIFLFNDRLTYTKFVESQKILDGIAYLNDISHHLFTLCLMVGLLFCVSAINKVNYVISTLIKNKIFAGTEVSFYKKTNELNFLQQRLYLLIPSVLFATPTLYFFLHITFLDGNNIWWGNIDYGYSGIYFSIIVSMMVFFGVYYTIHLLIVSFMCGKIMETEVSLRPFHEDGCNGLESLGLFILYLWGFAISLAAAIFVTLKFGYMGVEKEMYIWILSLMAVFCIPIIAIYPLYKSIVSAYRYRRNRLAKLEKRISTSIEKLDNNINEMTNKEFIEESDIYEKLMVLYKSIHEMNLWPFDVKVLISAIFVYILQALLIVKEVVSNINQL